MFFLNFVYLLIRTYVYHKHTVARETATSAKMGNNSGKATGKEQLKAGFREEYRLGRKLGEGAFGVVHECRRRTEPHATMGSAASAHGGAGAKGKKGAKGADNMEAEWVRGLLWMRYVFGRWRVSG